MSNPQPSDHIFVVVEMTREWCEDALKRGLGSQDITTRRAFESAIRAAVASPPEVVWMCADGRTHVDAAFHVPGSGSGGSHCVYGFRRDKHRLGYFVETSNG